MDEIIKLNHDTEDLVRAIIDCHKKDAAAYDEFAGKFLKDNITDTCEGLYKFCKDNVRFEMQPAEHQKIMTPKRFLIDLNGDSKNFAMFIAGILCSIKRSGALPITSIEYRFISTNKKVPVHHVFIVVESSLVDLWIDPIPQFKFNQRTDFPVVRSIPV